jgi:hypothetical protein
MSYEQDLEVYRSQLLESLGDRSTRSMRGASDPIQVYVNERRVGELEGAGGSTTLHIQSLDHIDTVQLRTEEGLLLAGLTAPEYGYKTDRLRISSDSVELCVHNASQGGGSLSAVFVPMASIWSRTWKSLSSIADMFVVHRPNPAPGFGVYEMRTIAFTQALLAIAVVGLVADRLTVWTTAEPTVPQVVQAEAPPAVSITEMAKFDDQIDELAQMQAKLLEAIGSQQKSSAQVQQAMAKLSSTQESFESSVLTVKQEMEQQLAVVGREVERVAHQPSNKTQARHGQVEAAIHSLTAENDRLSKEVAGLEQYNQDLKNKLLAVGLSSPKAEGANPNADKVLARQAEVEPPKEAQVVQNGQTQPFLFWVTFSEGASQESIDQWLLQMKGHKGAINEGWQEVRIVPPAVPPDRFLEQIRGEKIVKSARISQ